MAEPPPICNVLAFDDAIKFLAQKIVGGEVPQHVIACAILIHFSNGNLPLAGQLTPAFLREILMPKAHTVLKITGKQLYRWICRQTMYNPIPGREQWAKPLSSELSAAELADLQRSHDAVAEIMKEGSHDGK